MPALLIRTSMWFVSALRVARKEDMLFVLVMSRLG